MKKNDKFCFNRTLGYLILLVLVVVGFFYLMGKANQSSQTTKSEAAVVGSVCTDPTISGNPTNPCFAKKDTYKGTGGVCLKYTGCQVQSTGVCQTVNASSAELCVTKTACTTNQITEVFADGSCRYTTGTNRIDGSCAVGYETNKGKCNPGVGSQLGTASMNLSSCGAFLPDKSNNPCWSNNTAPTYVTDASGTLCLKNTACVHSDGVTCSTQAVSMNYCSPPLSSCTAALPNGGANPCFQYQNTYIEKNGMCLLYNGCANKDGATCTAKAVSMTNCSAPSKASCKTTLPDGSTTNPCYASKDTYALSQGLCLRQTGCVGADGVTCQTVNASSAALCVTKTACTTNQITEVFADGSCRYMTGTNRIDGSCAVGYETNKGKCNPGVGSQLGTASMNLSSCGASLPNGANNPCWSNNTAPTYKWDTSGTLCLKNTACVHSDGVTCSTQAVSTTYCPKTMWYCDTSATATCKQTGAPFGSINECQAALAPAGNNGFCFASQSDCKTNCP